MTLIRNIHEVCVDQDLLDAEFKGKGRWRLPFHLHVVYFTVKNHHSHISNQFQTHYHATEKVN